jgi:predicted MPP superfamily phosphohydrolase
MNSKFSRRDFLKLIKFFSATGLAAFLSSYYSLEFEPSWVDISQVQVSLPKLPKPFQDYKIVQISDLHMGGWMNRTHLEDVLLHVREQSPDLIVITGDFVIGHSWSDEIEQASHDFIEVMSPLSLEYKVIGVMGNHDHWTDVLKVKSMLSAAGIISLQNDIYRLTKNSEDLYIAGLDDVSEGKHRLEEVELKLPQNAKAILLAHEPDYATTTSKSGKFMMQLSGHSHGGQVVIPFVGPPVLPRWGRRYPAGLYQVGEMFLYTNRGIGMTSPFVRFNCRPEITVFTLQTSS